MVDAASPGRSAAGVSPDTAADSLAEARAIVRRIIGGLRVRVFLFGSRALGTSRPASDIDLAILPEEPVPEDLLARLRDAFEESTIPWWMWSTCPV